MKLIYYVIIRISLVLSVLLTGWAILFYFAVMDEVNDEVELTFDLKEPGDNTENVENLDLSKMMLE